VLGADVNITSRIVPFSPIGGIVISQKIQQNISSLPEYSTLYLGKPKLKGISKKIKIYNITSHGLPSNTKYKFLKYSSIFKIGVLLTIVIIILFINFYNLQLNEAYFQSNNESPSVTIIPPEIISPQNNHHINRTIAEDLIINISSYSGGEIILPSMKDVLSIKENLPRKIAKQLNSKYVLESSILINSREFELRCRLLNTITGKSPYSKSMKSNFENLSVILEIISIGVVNSLNVNIISPSKQKITPMDFSSTL